MKKFMYLLLGVASVIIYKAVAQGRAETQVPLPRRARKHSDRASSVSDEVAGPLHEV